MTNGIDTTPLESRRKTYSSTKALIEYSDLVHCCPALYKLVLRYPVCYGILLDELAACDA